MATFIAPLPSAFNHEAKDLASEFRYWRQCFNDFCEINKITDAQTLIKLFRSLVLKYGTDVVSNLQTVVWLGLPESFRLVCAQPGKHLCR